jgi:endo-1,4-beta-xylanase
VGKTLDRTNATKIMADHVSTIVKRYGTKLESWDVVNEPLQPASKAKRKDDLLTPGPWLDALGEEYIDLAYHLTKEANPEVLRVVNIFAVEHDTPEHETDRAAALNLLRRLLKRGVPIQAVGFESHIDALTPIGGRGVETFVNQILDMGLQILITELDVSDYAVKGDIAVRDRVVAQRYYDYLVLMVPLTKTNRVLFWSPTDAGNWMDWSRPHGRPDGTKFRPGLLDVDMAPKVAFTRVLDALEHIHSN